MEKFKKTLIITGAILLIAMAILARLYYVGIFGPHMQVSKVGFDQLPGWEQDDQSQAFSAFQLSCTQILKLPPNALFNKLPKATKADKWQGICLAAAKIKQPDQLTSKLFFEHWFDPYQIKNNFNPKGLFTGYYLPEISVRQHPDKEYNVPIYGLPDDLVKVDLGLFKPELSGKKIVGRVNNHMLMPYFSRAEITNGAISQLAPVLFWTNDPVKLFFAQIQGSTIIQLPDHQTKLIGYAGENGHRYTAIGKVLIEKNALTKSTVSMQTIQDWLSKHPEQINPVLNQDASYVFFRILKESSPLGLQQVPLTPQRSLAVDTGYIPLGTPVWLVTTVPESENKTQPYQRLLIAQDTGGSITGIIRGDIYFGPGPAAALMAGQMKHEGKYWILLPKE